MGASGSGARGIGVPQAWHAVSFFPDGILPGSIRYLRRQLGQTILTFFAGKIASRGMGRPHFLHLSADVPVGRAASSIRYFFWQCGQRNFTILLLPVMGLAKAGFEALEMINICKQTLFSNKRVKISSFFRAP